MSDQQPFDAETRLERLTRKSFGEQVLVGQGYSRFIRRARIVLPVLAAVIAAVVFSWNTITEHDVSVVKDAAEMPRQSGKNELLNPRFESTDDKNQPFTITAKRAVQDETDADVLLLDMPTGDLLLNSGNWLAVRAQQGAYGQVAGTLKLTGDVQMYHDSGYQMSMPLIEMDLKNQTAITDQPVQGFGPDLKLQAIGLKANAKSGDLIFTGPARLILERGMNGFDSAFSPAIPAQKETP